METHTHILKPLCREKLTPADFEFMSEVLASKRNQKRFFETLLCDNEIRDQMLDARPLFKAVLELNAVLMISSYFYFYILIRNLFLKKGIDDRMMADYVAMILTEVLSESRRQGEDTPKGHPFPYIVDMLTKLEEAGPHEQFRIHTEIGNHTLFFTGMLKKVIRARTNRRGAPGVRYYEAMGIQSFSLAGNAVLAEEMKMESLYKDLSAFFVDIRQSLNQISKEHIFLFETEELKKVARLLKDIDAAN
ncbi:MAG: hypothetical protein HQK83_05625 [Fibrobacteria bacterium]|nr:hypothetical protein [Fibrobacteria bacterium]